MQEQTYRQEERDRRTHAALAGFVVPSVGGDVTAMGSGPKFRQELRHVFR